MIGSKLAHYEITSHLGSGGMGDVYQAADSKLGRSVAIKFLPEAFSHDNERVTRFEREARVLASLNHSNIASIFGLEEYGDRKFLVMELVGGETLAERIKRGPISVDESLGIAKQICEALEAAHEKGIVHRDLKPANVKITPDGKVKVLDFGLAKAYEPQGADPNASNSPTLSMAATNAGVILGTAAYMSPEQALGKETDRRTDIFAFGAVLYEMLTGGPAFAGETVAQILARVIEREPDWSRLPVRTSPGICRLLERCLEKDRARRLQTAADARIRIEESATELVLLPLGEGGAKRRVRVERFAAILAIVLLAIPALRHLSETPPPSPTETRTDIVTPATTDPISFALSPDAGQLVFVASADGASRLWLRPLDKVTARPLAGTEGASFPFWSSDSRSVGFFADGKLKRVDLAGGSPQTITNAPSRGGAWSPDGVILFTPTIASPLFRIPASGGEAVAVTKFEKQTSHRFPQFLPGGRQFLFYALGTPETQGIYLGSLDAPETKRLTVADAAGVYDPAGWLLFIRGGTLLAQNLDLTRRELTGDPVTVVADPVAIDGQAVAGAVSVSAAGVVAYRSGGANRRQLTWFDRTGKGLGTVGAPDENSLQAPHLSPDGRRVAVHRTVQGNLDIWLLDADRTTRLTFDPSSEQFPIWSPDGGRIAFRSNRKGHYDLYQKPSSGAGSEELLVESAQDKNATDWSADDRFILYHSNDPQTSRDIWVLPLEGNRKPFVFLKTNFDEYLGQFSPDGRWVAYQSNESGRYEIYVRPFPGPSSPSGADGRGGGQWQVSTAGGINPRWGPGGKELDYIAPDGTLMAAPIAVNGVNLEPGRPVAVFRTRIFGGGTNLTVGRNYDIARDGRFLINTVLDDASSPITLIQNWHPERVGK